ncbi:conserved hypothetical protein [Paecilomyces variotii No. 5]|uniref:U6 snRNA phosphodiesterase n=1 Tax=Byssochlamys spectabilis (strain No. 5 / NBRC 109023) TaxID=1356009 RepID=V5FQD1_BYSSN|nr:conserved hypothetical protein [Paecilomyces variotii No. 5]
MALVQYSDSESDVDERRSQSASPARPAKKLRQDNRPSDRKDTYSLPALPANFHDLYASSTRVSVKDDPSLHGGRKRVIPHVEGNWPTHLYLEWYPSKSELNVLNDVLCQVRNELSHSNIKVHSLLQNDLGVYLPLHISLSRPVVLATEQRQQFLSFYEREILHSDIRPFNVSMKELDWVSNYEKTRWFLVMRVSKPEGDSLNNLLRISNHCLGSFGQPPLYENGNKYSSLSNEKSRNGTSRGRQKDHSQREAAESNVDYSNFFHISIGWNLDEPSLEDRERVGAIDLGKAKELRVHFRSVKAKIGNAVSNIDIQTKPLEEKGNSKYVSSISTRNGSVVESFHSFSMGVQTGLAADADAAFLRVGPAPQVLLLT